MVSVFCGKINECLYWTKIKNKQTKKNFFERHECCTSTSPVQERGNERWILTNRSDQLNTTAEDLWVNIDVEFKFVLLLLTVIFRAATADSQTTTDGFLQKRVQLFSFDKILSDVRLHADLFFILHTRREATKRGRYLNYSQTSGPGAIFRPANSHICPVTRPKLDPPKSHCTKPALRGPSCGWWFHWKAPTALTGILAQDYQATAGFHQRVKNTGPKTITRSVRGLEGDSPSVYGLFFISNSQLNIPGVHFLFFLL